MVHITVDRHRNVLKIAPDYRDAKLTIGLYNYIVGSLPLSLKIMAGTIGYRGSKKRGLETRSVLPTKADGLVILRVLLMDLYKREKRWKDAATLATDLSTRYPGSYIFKLQIADALSTDLASRRQKSSARPSPAEYDKIFEIFESLLRDQTLVELELRKSFTFGMVRHYCWQNKMSVQRVSFDCDKTQSGAWTRNDGATPGSSNMTCWKTTGGACGYRAVLTGPDIYNLHNEARRGLREPYKSSLK